MQFALFFSIVCVLENPPRSQSRQVALHRLSNSSLTIAACLVGARAAVLVPITDAARVYALPARTLRLVVLTGRGRCRVREQLAERDNSAVQ